MGSDADSISSTKPQPFVVVNAGGTMAQRFAAGTKAGFAVNRINQKRTEKEGNYSYIESVKEGEEPVEFGPDAELVNYGEGWTLRAVQDVNQVKLGSLRLDKVEPKTISQPAQKEFNPADFYPGGVLPDCRPPENKLTYFWNLFCVVGFLFVFAGLWVFLLESEFFLKAAADDL